MSTANKARRELREAEFTGPGRDLLALVRAAAVRLDMATDLSHKFADINATGTLSPTADAVWTTLWQLWVRFERAGGSK